MCTFYDLINVTYVVSHITIILLTLCILGNGACFFVGYCPLRSIRKCVIKIVTLKGAHLMW